MKTERGRRSATILLFLTGLGALIMGCVSVPSDPQHESQHEPGGSNDEAPEAPLMVARDPDESVPPVALEHLPAAPQPDLQWRSPSPGEPLSPPVAPDPQAGVDPPVPRLSAGPVPPPPPGFHQRPEVVLHPPRSSLLQGSLPDADVAALPEPERSAGEASGQAAAVGESTRRVAPVASASPSSSGTAQERREAVSSDSAPPSQENSPRVTQRAALSAAPSASRRAPREDSSGERTVEPGEPFEVVLPGRGWVYLGGGDALQFLDRVTEEGDVMFSFRGAAAESAATEPTTLEFESQDLTTGRRTRHEEQILVKEGSQREDSRDGGPADGGPADVGTAGDGDTSGDGSGQTAAAAVGGVPEDLTDATAEELLQRVDELEASQDHHGAVVLLEAMRSAGIGRDDTLIMRFAQIYEAEWSGRDLPRARELYHTVVENYPLSRWRGPARERIEYLNRHFFHIR